MTRSYKISISLAIVFLFCGTLIAQDDFREKIEEVKLEKLTKKLELDDKTKEVFIDKYKAFSRSIRTLNQKRVKTYKLITENIESGNGLDSLVNQLIDNETEINRKKEDFVIDMKSILTSQQIARMIIFERKFNNEIKKLLKQYQKESRNEKPFKED